MPESTAIERIRAAGSFCELFQATAAARADQIALRTSDGAVSITWREYAQRVRRIGAGLAVLGVSRGDIVALMLTNRPEFHLVDTAAYHLGATPFSIYNASSVEQIGYLFANAENTVVVCEAQFLPKVLEARRDGKVQHVVCVDEDRDEAEIMSLAELESAGRPDFDFEAAWRTVFAILKFSAFLTAAEAGLGPLDMLVNNAGIMPTGLFSDEDSAMTARMVDINVNGVLTGSRLAVERFRPRGSGHLVNIASLAGVTVLPGLATYCGTKRFVIGFTETLERELRADGIAVTLVLPGVVRTELSAGTRMPKWMTGISTVDPVLRERYHRRLTGGAA